MSALSIPSGNHAYRRFPQDTAHVTLGCSEVGISLSRPAETARDLPTLATRSAGALTENDFLVAGIQNGKGGDALLILLPHCTNCGHCIDVCASKVFHFTHRFKESPSPGRIRTRSSFASQVGKAAQIAQWR